VNGAGQVIYKQRCINPILRTAVAGILDLLLPGPVLVVVLARMRLANIDREELGPFIAESSLESV